MHKIITIPRTVEQKIISKKIEKNLFGIRMTTWRGKQSKQNVFVYTKILQNVFFLVYDWTQNALECTELNVEFQKFSGIDTPDLLFMLWDTLARPDRPLPWPGTY